MKDSFLTIEGLVKLENFTSELDERLTPILKRKNLTFSNMRFRACIDEHLLEISDANDHNLVFEISNPLKFISIASKLSTIRFVVRFNCYETRRLISSWAKSIGYVATNCILCGVTTTFTVYNRALIIHNSRNVWEIKLSRTRATDLAKILIKTFISDRKD